MDQTLGAAAPATVITLRLCARTQGRPLQAATCQNFANLIGNSLGQGCHIQPTVRNDAEMSLALIVPVTSQALTILRRLLAVQAELHRMRADARMSFLVHHGIVFPSGGSYIGSALRQARAKLARLPEHIEHGATSDFAGFAQSWDAQPIRFEKFADPDIDPGVLRFTLAATPGAATQGTPLADGAAVERLKRCLAEHLALCHGGRRRGARFEHHTAATGRGALQRDRRCAGPGTLPQRGSQRAAPTPQLKSPARRTTS